MSIEHPKAEVRTSLADHSSRDVVSAILASAQDGVMLLEAVRDDTARIVDFRWGDVNARAASTIAMVPEQLVGRRVAEVFPGFEGSALFREFCHVVDTGEGFRGDHRLTSGDGDLSFTISAAATTDGLAATLRNTTGGRNRPGTRARRHKGKHPSGLPGREGLHGAVKEILDRPTPGGTPVAVLFINMDRFKVINDSLGHRAGDELLRTVAQRLSQQMRGSDRVIHFGGDSFVVVVQHLDPGAVDSVAARLLRGINLPVMLGTHTISPSASIGIAVADNEDADATELIRHAEVAMARVKEHGGNQFTVFDPGVMERAADHFDVELELDTAMRSGEFENYYQPMVDLRSREQCGVETLVRWQHPTRGLVAPDTFIPVAENSGHIVPLGRQVIGSAIRQFARWQGEGRQDIGFTAVNAAPTEITAPNYARDVLQALEDASVAPIMLSLEITETAFVQDPAAVLHALQELSLAGVGIALDDFGTGFSSLTYLRDFPVTTIKIDKQFVAGIEGPGMDRSLVSAVIAMARSLDKFVVAEGVETELQAEMLTELGADFAQGYLFSRPKPAEEI